MATIFFLLSSILLLISLFTLKASEHVKNEKEYNLLYSKVLVYLGRIHLFDVKTSLEGNPVDSLPSNEEMDLLLKRARQNSKQARIVLAVLEDIIKENNITL